MQFSSLQQLDIHSDCVISNADIEVHSKHLQKLQADMEVRFQDVFQLEVPDWIIDPFGNITSEHGIIEEERITLQSDIELKAKFRTSYQSLWLQNEIKEILTCVGSGQTFFYCIFQLLRGRACFQRSDNAFGK